jgi:hypothetical protein
MLERLANAAALRQRAKRIRDAQELKQFTIELHNDRLLRALTADLLTDIEAADSKKVLAAVTRIVNNWIIEKIGKI